MEKIIVSKRSETDYLVRVESSSTTEHAVTLSSGYYQQLTGGEITPEALIRASFEFLLQREPNTSILRSFELPVISRYFPDFENRIRDYFKNG